jgi:hypothetical protein
MPAFRRGHPGSYLVPRQQPRTGRSALGDRRPLNRRKRRRVGVRRACQRRETPAALTFRSRPPGPELAVTRGSRSAEPEARGPADLGARHGAAPNGGGSTCPAGCSPLAPGERPLREAELDRSAQSVRFDKTILVGNWHISAPRRQLVGRTVYTPRAFRDRLATSKWRAGPTALTGAPHL